MLVSLAVENCRGGAGGGAFGSPVARTGAGYGACTVLGVTVAAAGLLNVHPLAQWLRRRPRPPTLSGCCSALERQSGEIGGRARAWAGGDAVAFRGGAQLTCSTRVMLEGTCGEHADEDHGALRVLRWPCLSNSEEDIGRNNERRRPCGWRVPSVTWLYQVL